MSSPAHDVAGDAELAAALAESQRLGMLGDRPVADVIEHAAAFVLALAEISGTVVDLGSGGGVPGLVIARARPDLRVVLVDRRSSRTDHLRRLVARLALADRVEVLTADATSLPNAGRAVPTRSSPAALPRRRRRSGPPRRSSGRAGSSSSASRPGRSPTAGPPISSTGSDSCATTRSDRRVAVFRRAGTDQVAPKP